VLIFVLNVALAFMPAGAGPKVPLISIFAFQILIFVFPFFIFYFPYILGGNTRASTNILIVAISHFVIPNAVCGARNLS